MKKKIDLKSVLNVLLPLVVALSVGAIIILCIGENPIEAYAALFEGAFNGKYDNVNFALTSADFLEFRPLNLDF